MIKIEEDERYQKLLTCLTPRSLCWIMNDLLTHRELLSLVKKVGIKFQGQDTGAVPPEDIIKNLSNQFFRNSDVSKSITMTFLKKRLKETGKFAKMDSTGIKDYIGDGKKIFKEHRVGKVLWVISIDERNDVNKLASCFIEKIEKIISDLDKNEKEKTKSQTSRSDNSSHKIKPKLKDDGDIKKKIQNLEDKIKAQANTATQVSDTNKRLKKENIILTTKLEKKEKEKNTLAGELEDAKKALFDQEIIFKEKKKLEKENKKLKESVKNKPRESSSAILLHRKNLQLRGEIARWEIKLKKLQRQLGIERYKEKLNANAVNPRVGVFVDVQNIYYGAKIGYQAKLNFHKLLKVVTKDRYLETAVAYIVQTPEINQAEFIKTLDRVGYTIKSKDLKRRADGSAKGDWDLGIAMDIISCHEKVDVVVLVSGDGDFIDLIKYLKENNITVEVAAFQHNASRDLIEIADTFYPIEEDMII